MNKTRARKSCNVTTLEIVEPTEGERAASEYPEALKMLDGCKVSMNETGEKLRDLVTGLRNMNIPLPKLTALLLHAKYPKDLVSKIRTLVAASDDVYRRFINHDIAFNRALTLARGGVQRSELLPAETITYLEIFIDSLITALPVGSGRATIKRKDLKVEFRFTRRNLSAEPHPVSETAPVSPLLTLPTQSGTPATA